MQWAAPSPPPPPGAAPDLPDIGGWLNRSFAAMWRRWRALLTIGLATTVPAGVLISVGIGFLLRDVRIVDDDFVGWETGRLPAAVTLWVIAGLLSAIGSIAAILLLLRDHDTGGATDPATTDGEIRAAGRSLLGTFAVLPRAIAWGLVAMLAIAAATLVLVVVFLVAWPLGLLLTLACLPLGFWLTIRWIFVGQALVDGPGNPFRRSSLVSRERFWPVCGRVLLMMLIAYGMSMAGNLAISPVVGFGGTFGGGIDVDDDVIDLGEALTPSVPAMVLTAAITAAAAVFVTGTIAAAFAELYRTRQPAIDR